MGFISRTSNEIVLARAQWRKVSENLQHKQLGMLGKVLRAGPDSSMWTTSSCPKGLRPATDRFVRRVGCPCKEWLADVLPVARYIAGGEANLIAMAQDKARWVVLIA